MRRTLFFIPHEIASIPVFGFGWALGLIVVAFAIRLLWAYRQQTRHRAASNQQHRAPTVAEVFASEWLFWGVAALLVTFLLPRVEVNNVEGDPVGMAVRGYGVMLLLGVVSATALAAYRAKRAGLDPDWIFSLIPWVFIGGIGGARLFYVIQYYHTFVGETWGETLRNMLAFTEGGLVVYGSFIGGVVAFLLFTLRHKLPPLRLGDVIVPCIFLGVFFGRIGCLFNGCCYGGRCEENWAALHFPPVTKVYREQLRSGELLGMNVDPETGRIRSVAGGSVAEQLGIEAGEIYQGGRFDDSVLAKAPKTLPAEDIVLGWEMQISGRLYLLEPSQLPARALPVRAAQPISSASALGLCLLLCGLSAVIKRPGAIMFLGFAGYAIVRFLLELVRVDESGQFNTSLTISQWVSVVVLAICICGLVWLYARPAATPPSGTPPAPKGV
jgi:phosphatidylglycerol:prolipoprotein diacylglycerol transferase